MTPPPKCFRCHRSPDKIDEYVDACPEDPVGYVFREEGTYSREHNTFACTLCYAIIGMPSRPGPRGWRAPPLLPTPEPPQRT